MTRIVVLILSVLVGTTACAADSETGDSIAAGQQPTIIAPAPAGDLHPPSSALEIDYANRALALFTQASTVGATTNTLPAGCTGPELHVECCYPPNPDDYHHTCCCRVDAGIGYCYCYAPLPHTDPGHGIPSEPIAPTSTERTER